MERITYARARLWLGISAVGSFVLAAGALLVLGVPAGALDGVGGRPLEDALALAAVLAIAALFALPFDLLGGYVLPKRFGRAHPGPAAFAGGWLRGVAALVAVSTASGTLLLFAGRLGGRPAALATFAAVLCALVLFQEPLARLVGGLRRVPSSALGGLEGPAIVLAGSDAGFSGGFTGLSATLVLPSHWGTDLDADALALLVERRRSILRSGAWRRSLALAGLWNVAGFLAASYLPGAGVRTPAELVTTALGFTLWTFVGLLILPTPSRRATRAADARVAVDGNTRERLARAVSSLDRMQDDEPERAAGVESVFHPVPSVTNRQRALAGEDRAGPGAWHLARTALWLSHAGLSLLPRAVHCNAGRPELWVYLPTDG